MSRLKRFIKAHRILLTSIITIALPAIGEMSLNTLLGLADTLMISRFIGPKALSAVGYANQIVFTLIFIFSSFNTGATAMISRAYGEEDYPKLNNIAGQAVCINVLIGIIITILAFLFAHEIFSIYDISREVYGLALNYFYIIVLGMIFMFLSFSCAAILRGAGNTVAPMIITGIANVINIIGNYMLITGFGPFPEMGIAGAAWSTTISRVIALIMYVNILFMKKGRVRIKMKDMKVTKNILKPLWNLSYPGAIEQALMQISFVIVGIIVSKLDTNSEAAFRILINIESISFMPAVGLSIAAATLVGKALGEKNIKKASNTGYTAATLGLLWGILIGLVFFILPEALVGIFTPEKKIIMISLTAMYFIGINQPLLNFMIVMSGALRGAGDTFSVMIITLLRLWIVFVPLTYLFIIVLDKGIEGVWYGEIISFLIFCIVIFIRFKSKKWTEIKIDT
ncbi:MATE family efflux transporter [Paramaledivibacter caminithermalis]|jgi:putative MATE family efflux protein|uniref:Probable multidrug resistance protein NorM n=1 Tax=Paramaledivibacter caminithermalis (strain DSM 15212 / CIP 107654 / DViRD3) TaxID=1121301 RepID=A0A1M6K1P2_PARC5|nr:MATE family efflux transporter [Paramaledivibacter caminithermalis]SHJ52896.1 putative efflux protein, MATE family [Paramaledivibacter caminithermalis DSM 15212]